MKIMRSLLAVVITLSLLAGFGGVQMKKTVFVEAKNKKIKVKAASDFTLKLPANWKNNYVMKKSKKIKHGSYVAVFPTDVQFEGAAKSAARQYQKLSKSVEKVARSIMP